MLTAERIATLHTKTSTAQGTAHRGYYRLTGHGGHATTRARLLLTAARHRIRVYPIDRLPGLPQYRRCRCSDGQTSEAHTYGEARA